MQNKKKAAPVVTPPPKPTLGWPLIVLLATGCAVLGAGWHSSRHEAALLEADNARIKGAVQPGISPQLDAWLAKSDAELDKADVVELNLLVARGLPENRDVDIEAAKQSFDRWAQDVRAALAEDPQGFERERDKWGTPQRFQLAVLGSVLMEDHHVGYVEKIDHGNAEHKFITGVLKNGSGTCATLPVVWTALGRRLGYSITMAFASEHFYCVVNDGADRINLETTSSAHLSMLTDEKLEKMCPPEFVKNGTFLRPFSNRELIGMFLLLRGEVWHARGDTEKALSDYQRAHEILPGNSVIAQNLFRVVQAIAEKHMPGPEPGTSSRIAEEQNERRRMRETILDVEALNRQNAARQRELWTTPTPVAPDQVFNPYNNQGQRP